MCGEEYLLAGSQKTCEPAFIAIGRIRRPHGVCGHVLSEILPQFHEKVQPGKRFYLGNNHKEFVLSEFRKHHRGLILAFIGFNDPEQVGYLRNEIIYITSDDAPPLNSDEYYHSELLGISIFDTSRGFIGQLSEIITTGANDVYVLINPDGKEVLIPALLSIIKSVDKTTRKMFITLPPDLAEFIDK